MFSYTLFGYLKPVYIHGRHPHWSLTIFWTIKYPLPTVTVASVHAPRQKNITYIQTVRRSIYKTRRPEQPHLSIWQYERLSQGPASRPHYMESYPFYRQDMSTSTATAMAMALRISAAIMITTSTAPLRQEPAHWHFRYPTLVPSLASLDPCWKLFLTGFDSIVFF